MDVRKAGTCKAARPSVQAQGECLLIILKARPSKQTTQLQHKMNRQTQVKVRAHNREAIRRSLSFQKKMRLEWLVQWQWMMRVDPIHPHRTPYILPTQWQWMMCV